MWLLKGLGGSGLGYHSLLGCCLNDECLKCFVHVVNDSAYFIIGFQSLWLLQEQGSWGRAVCGFFWQCDMKGQFTLPSAGLPPSLHFAGVAPFCQTQFVICLELKRYPGVRMSFLCSWPLSDVLLHFIYWPSGRGERRIFLIVVKTGFQPSCLPILCTGLCRWEKSLAVPLYSVSTSKIRKQPSWQFREQTNPTEQNPAWQHWSTGCCIEQPPAPRCLSFWRCHLP